MARIAIMLCISLRGTHANVLSAKGRWSEVAKLRKLMECRRVNNDGGMSWI